MSQAVAAFATAFVSRVSQRAAATVGDASSNPIGQELRAVEKALLVVQNMIAQAKTYEDRAILAHFYVPLAREAAGQYQRADVLLQEFFAEVAALNRAQRRPIEKAVKRLEDAASVFELLTNRLIEAVDQLDPTPEDFLEQEMHRIHPDSAVSVLASFKEIASSEESSLQSFKQRHNLK